MEEKPFCSLIQLDTCARLLRSPLVSHACTIHAFFYSRLRLPSSGTRSTAWWDTSSQLRSTSCKHFLSERVGSSLAASSSFFWHGSFGSGAADDEGNKEESISSLSTPDKILCKNSTLRIISVYSQDRLT